MDKLQLIQYLEKIDSALHRLAVYQAKARAFGLVRFLRNMRRKFGLPSLTATVVPGHMVRDIALPALARSRPVAV